MPFGLYVRKWSLEHFNNLATVVNSQQMVSRLSARLKPSVHIIYLKEMGSEHQSSIADFIADKSSHETDTEAHICPTCGQSGFASDQGMRQHHALAHDESLY